MADSVSCIACRIVYADPSGECHMQLPIFIDPEGALHASLATCDAEVVDLSHVCQGTCPPEEDSRKERLHRSLERALSEDSSAPGSPHRQWLEGCLKRLGSFQPGSAEEKDALRRALVSRRAASAAAPIEPIGPPRTAFLTYREQRLLLASH